MQLLRDSKLERYVQRVGQRLAGVISKEFQHPEFQYSFKVVNAKEINAFALPGSDVRQQRHDQRHENGVRDSRRDGP